MKKITLVLFALLTYAYTVNGQCIGTYEYTTVVSNNTGNIQSMYPDFPCNWSSDWNNVTGLLIGSDYEFSSDNPTDFLTFTDDSNNVIAAGTTPLSVTSMPVSSGRLHIYYDNTCTADDVCREVFLQCTSCTLPAASSCLSTVQYPEDPVVSNNDGYTQDISGCNFAGEFAQITGLTIGEDYEFVSDTGDNITITDTSDNVLAYGYSPVLITSIAYTDVKVHFHLTGNCDTEDVCRATTFECTSCTPPPAPDCATAPITPVDGATNVLVGVDVTFSWTAPASGPAPTSYNIYEVEDALGTNPGLIANTTDPFIDLNIGVYDTTVYWMVLPLNGSTEATGCNVWSFTTESTPLPPANDDCINAQVVVQETEIPDAASATATPGTIVSSTDSGLAAESCNGYTGTANDDVWYAFEALTEDVNITFEITGFDGVAQLYSGTCGALTVVDCADNTISTAPIVEEINATGLTVGATYYVRIYQYSGTSDTIGKSFDLKIWTSEALSVNEFNGDSLFSYYPNPVNNTLTLKAQKNIESVAVYNMLGQQVMRTAPNAVTNELDMSNLATGSYFVEVSVEGVSQTVRIVKQ